MGNRDFFWAQFRKAPLVGIIRNMAMEDFRQVLPVYRQSGLTTVEITLNTPRAPDLIRYALDQYAGSLNIGAGTVCNLTDLETALSAGAQFIVTPVMNPPVIAACKEQNIPIFAGAFTPSEIWQAWELGASMVKVYPAATLSPDYIKQIKAPLDQIKLLPTGGITLHNLAAFRNAGADGVGVGSPLFAQPYLQARNRAALAAHFRAFVHELRSFSPDHPPIESATESESR